MKLWASQSPNPTGSARTLAARPVSNETLPQRTPLRAARASFYGDISTAWTEAQQGEGSLETRRLLRTSTAHAVDLNRRHRPNVQQRFGTSVYEESALQRHFRDVHVASQHMMVAEPVLELAGRVMTGVDNNAPGYRNQNNEP